MNLRRLALFIIFLLSSAYAQVNYQSFETPVYLPDGQEFKTWHNRTEYSKTYHVAVNHPDASDANPGSADKPFRTIGQAAAVLQPGERVIIHSGIYRETIVPSRGGIADDKMISYEAASGESVVIKGSAILPSQWSPSRNPAQYSQKLWMIDLPASIFPGENTFAMQNANAADIEIMPWAAEWVGRPPYTLSRGLVFQNNQRLRELVSYEDLVHIPGAFWVDSTGTRLHIHPYQRQNPNEAIMEVTVRQHLFKPALTDLGFIQVKGLTFMHVGNGFPRTGTGALFSMGGHHWRIENNDFSGINSVAVEIGLRTVESADRNKNRADWQRLQENPGYTIVRGNVISDCGTGGVQGYVHRHTLVEDNHFYNIGWQDVERYWECAAVKLLATTNTIVRRNLIHDSQAGSAIWLDWDIRNSRITQNTVYDMVMCCNGALFIEAGQVPNSIDNNILWDIDGVPIYTGDTDSLWVAYNLIGNASGPGILSKVGTNRMLNGRKLTSKNNRFVKNIFITNRPMVIEDPDNFADENIFLSDFNLKEWQSDKFGVTSQQRSMTAVFQKSQHLLEINFDRPLPATSLIPFCETDFLNRQRNSATIAGPFQTLTVNSIKFNIDPRKRAD